MVEGEDEARAVARARDGDTEAFRFLVERHSRREARPERRLRTSVADS